MQRTPARVFLAVQIGEELCNVSVTSTRFAMLRNCWNEVLIRNVQCDDSRRAHSSEQGISVMFGFRTG
jgi:hypothetical protein